MRNSPEVSFPLMSIFQDLLSCKKHSSASFTALPKEPLVNEFTTGSYMLAYFLASTIPKPLSSQCRRRPHYRWPHPMLHRLPGPPSPHAVRTTRGPGPIRTAWRGPRGSTIDSKRRQKEDVSSAPKRSA